MLISTAKPISERHSSGSQSGRVSGGSPAGISPMTATSRPNHPAALATSAASTMVAMGASLTSTPAALAGTRQRSSAGLPHRRISHSSRSDPSPMTTVGRLTSPSAEGSRDNSAGSVEPESSTPSSCLS